MAEQIYATFPGVKSIKSVTFTMSPGISPSCGTIECFPQNETINEIGDLVLYGGDTITLKDCRIGKGAMVQSGSEVVLSLQVLDRRWKWAYGRIDGEYNLRDRKNLVVEGTGQDAYRLMEKCLLAMGEKADNFDTSAVPPGINPHVEWVGANPAKALADLCDELGFIVVLKLSGKVVIEKLGEGRDIPPDGAITISPVIDPPEGPDKITVIGAATRYQALLHLEAVGQDLDGTIKRINELSYAPAGGWTGGAPELQIPGTGREQDEKRRAARATVFRWYRVKISGADDAYGLKLPNASGELSTVYSLNEILPLSGDLVETYFELGRDRKKRARIYGTFYTGNGGPPRNSNQTRGPETSPGVYSPAWQTVSGSAINFPYQVRLATFPGVPSDFSIIEEFGIVEFPQPVYQSIGTGASQTFGEADLWLMCSFNWRNATYPGAAAIDSYEYKRYSYDKDMPGPKHQTGAEIINKEGELQQQWYATYTPGGELPIPAWVQLRTKDELDEAAKHYADGAAQKYVTVGALDITYCGLKEFDNDGAVHQVTWSVDESGPTTRVGRNTEPHPYVREFRFKRFLEKMAQLTRDPRALIPDLPHAYIPVV